MFVRTEHEYTYKQMFSPAAGYASSFIGVILSLKFSSQDHISYIATALNSVWPSVQVLNYYSHLSRKATEKTKLLQDSEFYKDHVVGNIKQRESA